MDVTVARKLHARFVLLQADLIDVNTRIEVNLDLRPGVFNIEAKDRFLRAKRDKILVKMLGFKR